MDTHYLINLRNILFSKLKEQRKWELALEDFKRITFVEAFVNNKNNDHYWRIIKGNILTSQQESVLIELYFLRENLAEALNRPPFKVFSNQTILELAKKMPRNEMQLANINGLSSKLVQRFGDKILKAISNGVSKTTNNKKEKFKPNGVFLQRFEALKQWRKKTASELAVESDIILPKEHMEQIAHMNNCSLSDIQKIMQNIPYRYERFGREIFFILENIEEE